MRKKKQTSKGCYYLLQIASSLRMSLGNARGSTGSPMVYLMSRDVIALKGRPWSMVNAAQNGLKGGKRQHVPREAKAGRCNLAKLQCKPSSIKTPHKRTFRWYKTKAWKRLNKNMGDMAATTRPLKTPRATYIHDSVILTASTQDHSHNLFTALIASSSQAAS